MTHALLNIRHATRLFRRGDPAHDAAGLVGAG